MKKRLITTIVTIILALSMGFSFAVSQANSVYADDLEGITIYSDAEIKQINLKVSDAQERIIAARQMDESAKKLGYEYTHDIRVLARQELASAQADYEEYAAKQEEAKWSPMMREYPVATIVWKYLIDEGYSEVVSAAIIGNMMTEVGGNTLSLDYTLGSAKFYGICQWKLKYCSEVYKEDLQGQLAYLNKTIEQEFNTFGNQYKKNFDYSDFLEMTDVRQAALAFSKCYERNEEGSYAKRQDNAVAAYEYFVEN